MKFNSIITEDNDSKFITIKYSMACKNTMNCGGLFAVLHIKTQMLLKIEFNKKWPNQVKDIIEK